MSHRNLIPRFAIPFLFIIFVLSLFATVRAESWCGKEVKEEGVTRVLNSATPMEKPRTQKPRELWRLGGESEADEEIFGFIGTVLADEAGDVYVLDGQLSEVRVFDAKGEYLRSIGGQGEGPGEFRSAMSMFFLPGGRIGVIQMMPARIAVLSKTGEAFADLPLPSEEGSAMVIIEQAMSVGGEIVMTTMTPIMAPDGMKTVRSLLALDGQGGVQATLRRESKESPGGRLSLGGHDEEDWFRNWRLGTDRRIYATPHYSGYKIYVSRLDGTLERIVEMDYEPLKRTKDQIAELEARNPGFTRPGGATIEFEVNEYSRDIDTAYPRDSGELWVLSSRGVRDCPEGKLGAFDVFDARGRYLRRVTLDVPYDSRYDDFRIQGDKLFVIKEANSGPGLTSSMNTGGGGHMMMMVAGGNGPGGDDEEDEREPLPLEIICYELGD